MVVSLVFLPFVLTMFANIWFCQLAFTTSHFYSRFYVPEWCGADPADG